jgi:glycosyltransferase involved in cell wall biosynthesis
MNPSPAKKRILILPSYWPVRNAPVVGAQVHEQTQLIAGEFDVKVLYCMPGMGWKRYVWYRLIKLLTGKQPTESCAQEFLNGPLDTRGIYYFRSRRFSYRKNRDLEARAFELLLKQLIDEGWKPDMIHARTAEFAGVNAARLARKHNIPLLLTENVIFVLKDQPEIDRFKGYQHAIESADVVAVVSNFVKSLLLINNFDCQPITVGNWVDEKNFRLRPANDPETFTIINIGHTGFTKDWPTFFRAIHYLVNDLACTDIKLILAITHVFDEESRNFIPKMAAEYGVAEKCEILYQVPHREVAALYHNSSVMVSTSVNETFGIATCEAMFCGVPVIATANGGIDDILSEIAGIKVAIGDHIGVANAIKDIYDGKKSFDPAAIRESVLAKFGTAAFRQRLIALYETTMGKL